MSANILILDTVATNRIVLKVKMSNAQYHVRACGSVEEAEAAIAEQMPDLILMNLSDPVEDRHGFCRKLKSNPQTKGIAVISIGIADTAPARFAALDAGADDVLPRPMNDTLLLARVRSLLRRRNIAAEWQLRDGLGKMFGFEEGRDQRLRPARVTVLSAQDGLGTSLASQLQTGLGHAVQLLPYDQGLLPGIASPAADLMVLDGSTAGDNPEPLFRHIADLHSRQSRQRAAILVHVPADRPDIAAMALDLGADDVISPVCGEEEVVLRARVLIAEQAKYEEIRAQVRHGLKAAVTDPLTGLSNRRYAETELRTLAEQARASNCQYALLMVDIDHFKTINDTHGHAAGDAVLTEMAIRLQRGFRAIDLVARIGGEEFLIAMPNTPLIAAELAAERLRKLIDGQPFTVPTCTMPLKVTVSVGIAVDALEEAEAPSLSDMLTRADKALYAAKSAGRNTVSVANIAAA